MSARIACGAFMGILLFLISTGVSQTPPVLTVRFDDGLDAAGKNVVVAGKRIGNPVLAPGRAGQALRSGPGTGYVEYPTKGIVSPASGTVEMWVCPLDWRPEDEEFHVFFDARGEGALYLYKYYQGVRLLMLTCENTAGPYFSSSMDLDWQPGQWHHIAGTWSADGGLCYVDGKTKAKMPAEGLLPKSLGDAFRIGDDPWHLPRTSSSLIDEVRIYDRALTPAHVMAHFQGNYAFTAPLTPESIILHDEIDPKSNTVNVRVSTGADVDHQRLSARFAVVAKGAGFPEAAPVVAFTGGRAEGSFALPSTKPGTYELLARVHLDGKQVAELRRDVIIPDTEWQGNMLGLEEKVLPPWTPLEVKDNTVGCWGREYDFNGSPLPTRITSAGESLLARPASLRLSAAGQPMTGKMQMRWGKSSPTCVELSGALTGTLGDKPVQVNIDTRVEYDGLVLLTFSLPQADLPPLDEAVLEIPIRAAHAIYRHRWARAWAGLTGNLPEGEGVADKDSFIPYYWLGDNDRGLFWFCESDEMWPNGQSPNAIEVVRSGDEVVLRLILLAAGQKLPPNWRFVCGLQATPVKPIPKDWRKWRLQPGRDANVSILWPTPAKDSLRYYGYPQATDPKLFSERVAKLHAQNVKAVPYLCLSFLSAACPEWPFFRREWAMGPVDSGSADVAAYGAGFAMVSPVGKGFSDFIIWKNKQFIDQYGIDGLYHDNTHPYSSPNRDAGLGYERDGKARPTYPILGYRALYRRMYSIVKGLPRETFTMAHMSGKVTIPILAYDDSYLDGEHFRGSVKDSYMDLLSLDTFRAEFMGRQWGIMPFFLPEFHPPYSEQMEPTRGLMALLMIHDVSPWPIWCNAAVMNEALAALDEFGCVDARFLAYFDAAPPATTDMKDVYISAYQRPDGRTLLIAGNLSREDRQGEIRIDAKRLGVAPDRMATWPDKQPLTPTDGRLRLDVPRLGYRMIVAERL